MKNDAFYVIWLAAIAIICVVAIASVLYTVRECDKAGGRYMRELFGSFQCIVPEK